MQRKQNSGAQDDAPSFVSLAKHVVGTMVVFCFYFILCCLRMQSHKKKLLLNYIRDDDIRPML